MTTWDASALDQQYNVRALVPECASTLQRWAKNSESEREQQDCFLDISYGPGVNETLDVFPCESNQAPVLIFIHGGYWRSLDKADHSFIAPAFTQQGVCVVVPNYALCPAATLPQIVLQLVQSVAWVYHNIHLYGGDRNRITVAGHSAGGHLAAMMLSCLWPAFDPDLPVDVVKNALAISGLYELDSVMHSPYLQETLHLTSAQVARTSPAWMPAPVTGWLASVVGGDETPAFHRHSALIRQAWGGQAVPICESLPSLNHFSVLESLALPGQRLHQLALDMLLK
jgi:arylformamidase